MNSEFHKDIYSISYFRIRKLHIYCQSQRNISLAQDFEMNIYTCVQKKIVTVNKYSFLL